LRKGNALEGQQKYEEALNVYQLGLKKDKNNAQLLEAYKKLEFNLNNLDENNEGYNRNEEELNENKINKEICLLEKYALKKSVKIYFAHQISSKLYMNGAIEEIKEKQFNYKSHSCWYHC